MLFSLVRALGWDEKPEKSNSRDKVSVRVQRPPNSPSKTLDNPSNQENQQQYGARHVRRFRQVPNLKDVALGQNSANDDGLPKNHYRGDHLVFEMMPFASVEAMRLKLGDSDWIAAKLRRVPHKDRKRIADEYSEQYKAAYDAEQDENKKANRAAFIANSWLLKVTQ